MKRRILFIGPLPPPYHGVSVANQILLSSKEISDFEVITVNTAGGKRIDEIGKTNFNNFRINLFSIFQVLKVLTSKNIDLIYVPISQNTQAFLRDSAFIILSKIFRKKLLLHLHGGYFRVFYNNSSEFMRYFIKKCLNYAEGVIVLGNTLKHIFDGLIPNEKIFIVENGIDITYSSTKVLSKEIRDKKRILYLGNLVESKGIFDIVKSIPKVVKENSNVIFTFIGAWDNFKFKSEVMEFIHQNSLENYTEFLGVLSGEKKSKMVLNSDIFVFPTFYPFEGQPLVLIEAMAAGLPIITTDHGCIAEMIEDKVNGIIIEKHNPIMIKEALISMLSCDDARRTFAENNIKKYNNFYTAKHFTKRFIKVVKEILLEKV